MLKISSVLLLAVSLSAGAEPINDEVAALDAAWAALEKYQLTELKKECLTLVALDATADSYPINVHEKHDEHCGGDPATAPRLFTISVRKADGALWVDDPVSGTERPLDRSASVD